MNQLKGILPICLGVTQSDNSQLPRFIGGDVCVVLISFMLYLSYPRLFYTQGYPSGYIYIYIYIYIY